MKLFQFIVIGLVALFACNSVSAVSPKDIRKERREKIKEARKDLNAKASKDARLRAKQMEKEEWMPAPGTMTLEKQFDRMFIMEEDYDDDGIQKYFFGTGQATGGTFEAAKLQATELAKNYIAGQIETIVGSEIESEVTNQHVSDANVVTNTETEAAVKSRIRQSLRRVVPVFEAYRKVNGRYEVQVRLAYSQALAKESVDKLIRQELSKKAEPLHEKLDRDFDE